MEAQQTLSFEIEGSDDRKSPSKLFFEQLLIGTLDKVFSSLGINRQEAIYNYMEKEYGVGKSDIADHIVEFCEGLEHMFGDASALLEIEIMKDLYKKVPNFEYSVEGTLTFSDYMNALGLFLF